MGPGFSLNSLLGKSQGLPMPKMPVRGERSITVEERLEPEADTNPEAQDDEETKESIGFTDSTMRCAACEHHDGGSCAMYAIQCGPEDGCRVGFEPRSEVGGLANGEEEEQPDEMVP